MLPENKFKKSKKRTDTSNQKTWKIVHEKKYQNGLAVKSSAKKMQILCKYRFGFLHGEKKRPTPPPQSVIEQTNLVRNQVCGHASNGSHTNTTLNTQTIEQLRADQPFLDYPSSAPRQSGLLLGNILARYKRSTIEPSILTKISFQRFRVSLWFLVHV